MKKLMLATFAALLMHGALLPALAQDDAASAPPMASDIRGALKAQTGKTATVHLRSGQELSGTVSFVGDQVVRLTRLTGKDFYDAAVRLDDISAVVIKER